MDQPDGDADSRAIEEGRGKELEHADSSEVEQQATATAASTSTEWGNLVRMLGEMGSPVQSWPSNLVVQKHSVNGLATNPLFFQPYWIRLANHWNLLIFAVADIWL